MATPKKSTSAAKKPRAAAKKPRAKAASSAPSAAPAVAQGGARELTLAEKYASFPAEDRKKLMVEEATLMNLQLKAQQTASQLETINLQAEILKARINLGKVKKSYQDYIGNS
jgi:hypothetical protein